MLVVLIFVGCRGADSAPFSESEHENVLLPQLPEEEGEVEALVLGEWGGGRYVQDEVAVEAGRVADVVDAEFIATTADNFYRSDVGSVQDSHWDESHEDVYTHDATGALWEIACEHHPFYSARKHGSDRRLIQQLCPFFRNYSVQLTLPAMTITCST